MHTPMEKLENLFYKKIMLYQELVEVLAEERAFLIKTEMDALWEISDKKQDIARRIEAIRADIIQALSEASVVYQADVTPFSLSAVLSVIPHGERDRFRKHYLSLVNLKAEIRQRSQENKRFVEQSLDFLDELIGILTNSTETNEAYTNSGASSDNNGGNLLLHKEV